MSFQHAVNIKTSNLKKKKKKTSNFVLLYLQNFVFFKNSSTEI